MADRQECIPRGYGEPIELTGNPEYRGKQGGGDGKPVECASPLAQKGEQEGEEEERFSRLQAGLQRLQELDGMSIEVFIRPSGESGCAEKFKAAEPEILAIRRVQSKQAQRGQAGKQNEEQEIVLRGLVAEKMVILQRLSRVQEVELAKGGCGCRAAAREHLPARPMPDTDGNLQSLARDEQVGRYGEDLGAIAGVGPGMGRKSSILADEPAAGKDLVAGHDAAHEEAEGSGAVRHHYLKAVPGHAPVILVSLGAPAAVGTQQCPGGVVEAWIGPARVVASMKAPQAVEHSDGRVVFFDVEELCRDLDCNGEEKQGKT